MTTPIIVAVMKARATTVISRAGSRVSSSAVGVGATAVPAGGARSSRTFAALLLQQSSTRGTSSSAKAGRGYQHWSSLGNMNEGKKSFPFLRSSPAFVIGPANTSHQCDRRFLSTQQQQPVGNLGGAARRRRSLHSHNNRGVAGMRSAASFSPSAGGAAMRVGNVSSRRRQQKQSLLGATVTEEQQTCNAESAGSSGSSKIYPVSATHIAQTIDLFPVISTLFARDFIRKQMIDKNSFVVQLPAAGDENDDGSLEGTRSAAGAPPQPPRYVAVFRFGSVVFFNIPPREVASLVADIKKHSTDPVLSGFERKEHFGVLVSPPVPEAEAGGGPPLRGGDGYHLPTEEGNEAATAALAAAPATQVTADYCVVPELDLNGVGVISNIMAQTVALDSYNDVVDDILAEFFKINQDVTRTGKFASSHRDFLFKTVAQNNMIFVDMISKIRIKDRSDTAWRLTEYEPIHYQMKDEFEIDDRFEQIEFKLNLIQQNAKFFLEVLQSQKSNSLEWIIVVLIAVECVIMCADMSGLGEEMVRPLLELLQLPLPPKP